ncbi:helix-turn-helix domain-containing protein, partial [Kingella kingae]
MELKTYLEQTGLSQRNAAKALGVTKPVLNAYLQNKYHLLAGRRLRKLL